MAAPWEENYAKAPPDTTNNNTEVSASRQESPIKVDMPVGVAGAIEPPAIAKTATTAVTQAPKATVVNQPKTKEQPPAQEQPLIPEWAKFPLAVGAGGAAVAAAAKAGSALWGTLKDKMANGNGSSNVVERREPALFGAQRLDEPAWSASANAPLSEAEIMDRLNSLSHETSVVNEPAFAQVPQAAAPAVPQGPNLTLEEAQARMAGVTPAASEMVGPIAPVGPPKPIAPSAAPNSAATKAVTETIQQLGQAETPVAAMPSRPVTPTPAAALPTGELRTGSGLPAYAGEGKPRERFPKEFKSTADIPKGYAFIPGAGPGTNTMRNLVGQEGYNEAVRLHGGPFGSHQEAVDFMDKYNAETRIGPPADRELRKSLGLSMPENTKGIPFKVPKAKVAGVAGAIVAMSDVVNAATNATRTGNVGPLVETAFDIGVGAIPVVGTAATALTGSTLQSGKLFNENPYTEVLNRSGVRDVLANMRKTMSPDEFNVAREQYLSKVSSFPEYNSLRFTKPVIGSNQPVNRRTLLPIAPPTR